MTSTHEQIAEEIATSGFFHPDGTVAAPTTNRSTHEDLADALTKTGVALDRIAKHLIALHNAQPDAPTEISVAAKRPLDEIRAEIASTQSAIADFSRTEKYDPDCILNQRAAAALEYSSSFKIPENIIAKMTGLSAEEATEVKHNWLHHRVKTGLEGEHLHYLAGHEDLTNLRTKLSALQIELAETESAQGLPASEQAHDASRPRTIKQSVGAALQHIFGAFGDHHKIEWATHGDTLHAAAKLGMLADAPITELLVPANTGRAGHVDIIRGELNEIDQNLADVQSILGTRGNMPHTVALLAQFRAIWINGFREAITEDLKGASVLKPLQPLRTTGPVTGSPSGTTSAQL